MGLWKFLLVAMFMSAALSRAAEAVEAKATTGFVKVSAERSLYVDYIKPAPGKPIAVLLNGLTYRTGSWDLFVDQLKGQGLGILRYDMFGQGKTLMKYAPIQDAISLESQVEDLGALLDALKINQPVHLIALSYGAAVGIPFTIAAPERVASLVLMAPFVAPLESQDQWIKLQIEQTRIMFPNNPASYDELYDYFLKVIIYQTYPLAEPIVLENPYKLEAVYRLVQGARKFIAAEYVDQLPPGKTHLVIARRDQYVPNNIHESFWKKLPAAARASFITIDDCEHKIPEAFPNYSSDWIRLIIAGDPRISNDRNFTGSPYKGNAVSGSIVIEGLGD